MATKLSKKFQTVLCGSLKTYGDSDLFWSYLGNGLVRIPKTAAGLGGARTKETIDARIKQKLYTKFVY